MFSFSLAEDFSRKRWPAFSLIIHHSNTRVFTWVGPGAWSHLSRWQLGQPRASVVPSKIQCSSQGHGGRGPLLHQLRVIRAGGGRLSEPWSSLSLLVWAAAASITPSKLSSREANYSSVGHTPQTAGNICQAFPKNLSPTSSPSRIGIRRACGW